MTRHRIYSTTVASVYPLYVTKAERKGRTQAEVDEILCWLTGHSEETLKDHQASGVTLEDFFVQAPRMNTARTRITGLVCGVRVVNVEEPTIREIRYLVRLTD